MTKEGFIAAMRRDLKERYDWATDLDRLDRFMASVRRTLETGANTWNKDGESTVAAWRAIGGKGRPTYAQLRALPAGQLGD